MVARTPALDDAPAKRLGYRGSMPVWGRIQRAGAVALPVLSIAFLLARGGCSPDVPFISKSADSPWITVPSVVSAQLQQWGHADVPRASFVRSFAAI